MGSNYNNSIIILNCSDVNEVGEKSHKTVDLLNDTNNNLHKCFFNKL